MHSLMCGPRRTQPKGAAANKWKSKVRWDLLGEIDITSMDKDQEMIEGVEKEIKDRLYQKALVSKYLAQVPAGSEEDSFVT